VRFNDARFQQDIQRARPAGREIGLQARAALERDGVDSSLLARCAGEHRDGTDLPGMVNLYLPIPYGDWGLVLQAANDNAGLHLLAVAFGERHPAIGTSVYQIAHRRLHNA
jgi:hypothetical protein